LDGRIFVIEQDGRVIAFDDLSSATVLDITDLTSADAERGLLGLAFHPERNLAYVNFTDNDGNTVVAEFEIDPDSAVFDEDSYREVLTISQPFSNHNGGNIAFGPDGLLYIGMGDGGSADDPNRSALDLSQQLGKILRIDPLPNGDEPYSVPEGNPFVGVAGTDETIWSFGLRNPWRFSFDPVTGDLWIADVGQNTVEEINWAPAADRLDAGRGVNFGWSAFEGNDRFNDDQPADDHNPPIYAYNHDDGRCSVSGGVRYRGESIPDLPGWYVFGDFCTGEIWALDPSAPADSPRVVDLGQLSGLSSIAQGPERELYAVSNAGTIARFSFSS
jgi:glucose/arabinose dehydrogenase